MRTDMAQIIALARHGNAVLRGQDVKPFAKDITAQICARIEFVAVVKGMLGKRKQKPVAHDADEWLRELKRKGCSGLRLIQEERDWAIEALMPDHMSHLWMPRWDEDGARPCVTYGLFAIAPTPQNIGPDVEEISQKLERALTEIHDFAQKHKADPFTGHFAAALKELRKGNLYDACCGAWVFGGMGSWNDLGFSGAEGDAYDRLTRQLHEALIPGFIASASA